jgi:hypothetical protein
MGRLCDVVVAHRGEGPPCGGCGAVIMDYSSSNSIHPALPAQHAFDAFISYAAEDRRIASHLQVFLQRFRTPDGRRLRVYLDETHIRGGDLTEELAAALESSAALIVVCSHASASSAWVRREIDLFLERGRPRIALVLAADDPPSAIPASLRSSEIRLHDVRRGLVATVWKPGARNEMLRLVAWLTDADLSTLINWERRRLLKVSVVAAGALLLPLSAVYRYAGRRRPIEASDVTVEIVLSWIDEESAARGGTIDEAMLNSPRLHIDVLPRSAVSGPPRWTWPANAQSNAGMEGNAVHLVGRLESRASRSSPSTDGVWHESTRRFGLDATSLGSLSSIDEWDGAVAAVAYSALGLGTKRPAVDSIAEAEHDKELTAQAKKFYEIDAAQWQEMDYSIRGVPVRGSLTLSLRNRPVARAQAMGLRVWEYDEDVRDLHVLVFRPFRLGTPAF